MYQNRSLTRFILLSALLHLMFMTLTGIFTPVADRAAPPPPVKIRIVPPTPTPPDNDPLKGRIEDLPAPVEEQIPEQADILSRGDSVAHSPMKGDTYQASKTAIPRKRLDPAAPALEKTPQPKERTAPTPVASKVASLNKPELDMTRKNSAEKLDLFSKEALEQALSTEKVNRAEKGRKNPRKTTAPSVTITDRSDPKSNRAEPVTGVEAEGSELDPMPLSKTDDGVIDMGDEAVVSLNTTHFAYVDYFTGIKKAVELVWVYPEEGVLRGWSGTAKIRFSLDSQGRLLDVRLLGTSGHKPLDDEALMAIKVAGPFKPFPADMKKKKLHIVGDFVYLPSYGPVH